MTEIMIGSHVISQKKPLVAIMGPCAIENRDFLLRHAEALKKISEELAIPFVFKSSFDKANRSSIRSKRGVGIQEGLQYLQEVKDIFDIPVITDVHEVGQVNTVAEVVDIIQIPAFLSRQTDLIIAAACTQKPVMIKKAQFMAPEDMKQIVDKMESVGNSHVLLCERGTIFGYHTLINDMRALPMMASLHKPVVFDATHSVQQPGAGHTITTGERHFIPYLARAAVSVGIAGIFMEVHEDPEKAISDAAVQWPLIHTKSLLQELIQLDKWAKKAHAYSL